MKTPVRLAVVTVAVTMTLSFLLMEPLGHAGLTLATSLGALFNAVTLLVLLRRRRYYVPVRGWLVFVAKIVVAAGVLAGVLAALGGPASAWMQAGLAERGARLALLMAAGGAAYFGSLWLLGFRLRDFSRREQGPEVPAVPADE
jgi:putative peptidoglycan lipid II flippase